MASDVTTPKEKLNFNLTEELPVLVSTDPNAPKWANGLITSVLDLKNEIKRVGAIAESTQKVIKTAIDDNQSLTNNITKLTDRIDQLEVESSFLKNENSDLKEKLLLLEFHQRRNNLVFSGIEESNSSESGRDCYNKIMWCISNIPDLDLDSIRINRCHRLGPKVPNKTRDIIAKCNWYGDLVDVMRGRGHLPNKIYVNEDYPDEWLDRRSLLRPILKRAKEIPKFQHKAKLVRDKLIIDGKPYTIEPVNNLRELPPEIKPAETCEKRDMNTIAFLGPHSVFSNFHHANFKEGGMKFNCAEQMIQAEKTALFKDKTTPEKIMRSTNPYKIKALGSRVRGFEREQWKTKSRSIVSRAVRAIVSRAVRAKFTQNPLLAKLLVSTLKKKEKCRLKVNEC